MKIKKGFKQFILRLVVFILLGFIAVPFLIESIAQLLSVTRTITLNYTYMPLFILAILAIFILHERKRLLSLRPYNQKTSETIAFSVLSLFTFGLHFVFSYLVSLSFLEANLYPIVGIGYLTFALGIIFLGLAVFNFTFFRKFYNTLMISIMVSVLFFIYTFVMRLSWHFFSDVVAKLSYWLLSIVFNTATLTFPYASPSLSLAGFGVTIGSPCSGVASLTMFTTLYIAIAALDWRILNKKKLAILFIPGLIGMFIMSVIRIFLLMVVGAYISQDIALSLFHTNLGWILFVIYLLGFWYYAYPYLKK